MTIAVSPKRRTCICADDDGT